MDYKLFLGESGHFKDTSTDQAERNSEPQKCPSQLAGVLAPKGEFTEQSVGDLLNEIFVAAGLKRPIQVHGKGLVRQSREYQTIIGSTRNPVGKKSGLSCGNPL